MEHCGQNNAGGIEHGQNSFYYGQSTLPSSHQWSLVSSGDYLRTSSYWTLLDRLLSFLISSYNSSLPTEIVRRIVRSISALLLLFGQLSHLPYIFTVIHIVSLLAFRLNSVQ